MTGPTMTCPSDLEPGMVTRDYVVIFKSEIRDEEGDVVLRVQWRDGGTTRRVWDADAADNPTVPVLANVEEGMTATLQGSIFERAQTYVWAYLS